MKKTLALFLTVLSLFGILTMPAAAATTDLTVRVNGYAVEFPDAQPYIDENSRTLIPVRFVTEAMDADVSWVQATQTAVIERNGIKVEITIGKKDIKVTKNGKTETVTMDTVAVNKESRTYVPIRFVAEALGAYVDYSNTYRTVGIFCDVLSPDEIELLQNFDYTSADTAEHYDDFKDEFTAEQMEHYYGLNRASFNVYANAREFLYNEVDKKHADYNFKLCEDMQGGTYTIEEFYQRCVEEVVAEITYHSDTLDIDVKTDSSCIYHADDWTGFNVIVRAIVTASICEKPENYNGYTFTSEECRRRQDLGANTLKFGETGVYYIDFVVQTLHAEAGRVAIIQINQLAEPIVS